MYHISENSPATKGLNLPLIFIGQSRAFLPGGERHPLFTLQYFAIFISSSKPWYIELFYLCIIEAK